MIDKEFISLIRKLSEVVGMVRSSFWIEEDADKSENLDIIKDELNEVIDLLIEDKFKELDNAI